MLILQSPQILHQKVSQWKPTQKVFFVPTMGCLHAGHRALIERAKQEGGKVLVSIFVNPLQFGPSEDFDRYPRPFEEDVKLLESLDVDCLFAPRTVDLYPDGFATNVSVKGLAEHLCGKSRPGHFDGVATVCLKLFQITQADGAIFGEKDYQQLRILEKMVEDLNLGVHIMPHPTVREEDGLALSSRNRYLSPEDRKKAVLFPQALCAARERALLDPSVTVGDLLRQALTSWNQAFPVDYLEIAPSDTLTPASPDARIRDLRNPRVFGAIKLGSTRLIDNLALHLVEGR